MRSRMVVTMPASDHLNPEQFGLRSAPDYMPEKLNEYEPSTVETVDPRSLTATQGRLERKPSLAKITLPGRQHPPNVYEDPDTKERFIGDGHHRIAAHAAADKPVRVKVWRRKQNDSSGGES